MTKEEADALAKTLWGEKGWADHCEGFTWAYGVGVGDRTLGTGDSFDEAFERAKEHEAKMRAMPSLFGVLL